MASAAIRRPLRMALLLGSTRTRGPPALNGGRVSRFVQAQISRAGHEFDIVDPAGGLLPLLEKPHFAYAEAHVPDQLRELASVLRRADAYVVVTPEYNHAPSPALVNVLNHFGSSLFSFKPSLIVSYSASQWGGTRAAHSLRPILSELGCLPVSAMLHIARAGETLGADGVPEGGEEAAARWDSYADRGMSQLEWWASATRAHRAKVNPLERSPAFFETAQRNAP